MEDREIIALFQARSQQAVEALAGRYEALGRQVAFGVLASPWDVEECVNDAYFGVWNTIPPQEPGSLRAYFCRIVRNQALKRVEHDTAQKRNAAFDAALEELAACLAVPETVESQITARELTEAIDRFLGTLKREDRVLFLRRHWFGDDLPALATRFGRSEHATVMRLSRIRSKLRCYLKQEGMLP